MKDYDRSLLRQAAAVRVWKVFRCRECMNPLLLRWLFKWHDGVITLRLLNRNFRFAFIENDMLREVIDLLVEQFGEEHVYEIARNVERGSAIGYVSMLFLADQWWARPLTYAARYSFLLDLLLEMNVGFLGYGAGEIAHRKMPTAALYMRNPYNKILFQADVEACYLIARDRETTMKPDPVSEAEEVYLYAGTPASKRTPGAFKKYLFDTAPVSTVADPYSFTTCPKCGVPLKIARFWWDTRLGIIVHKDTGRRMILWPCYALERLLGALEEQLGEEAGELIYATVRDYQKNSILSGGIGFTPEEKLAFVEEDKKGQYRLLLHHLACMGFGNGVVAVEEGGRIKVTTTNSLVPQVTSGLLAGMAEALEGQPVGVTWEVGPKTTTYTLELQQA